MNTLNHVAIIMDANGRWAKEQGKPRTFGHYEGVKNVRRIAIHANDVGVKALTLYAFSTENWKRPLEEVSYLMSLPKIFFEAYLKELTMHYGKNNVERFEEAVNSFPEIPDKTTPENAQALIAQYKTVLESYNKLSSAEKNKVSVSVINRFKLSCIIKLKCDCIPFCFTVIGINNSRSILCCNIKLCSEAFKSRSTVNIFTAET